MPQHGRGNPRRIGQAGRQCCALDRLRAEDAGNGCDPYSRVRPGRVLAGLVRRIAPEITVANVSDLASVKNVIAQLNA